MKQGLLMPLRKCLQALAVTTACVGMIVPTQYVDAEDPLPPRQPDATVDVALGEDGALTGLVVDGSGQPKSDLSIQVQQFETSVASVRTDAGGEFRCQLQSGGIYLLAVGDQVVMLRCWAPGTAPPHARTRVVVQATDVVRGQVSPATCSLANPWLITGVAIAAIVIPVALHNNRTDRENPLTR